MRYIVDKIIDDRVLIDYSFEGAGKKGKEKKPFKEFPNIVRFIVQTSMEAYNYFNEDEDGFRKATKDEVFNHFKSSYLKYDKQRSGKK